jgi:hypothetical protein
MHRGTVRAVHGVNREHGTDAARSTGAPRSGVCVSSLSYSGGARITHEAREVWLWGGWCKLVAAAAAAAASWALVELVVEAVEECGTE